MKPEPTIVVYMTNIEAKNFVLFQKYRGLIDLLESVGDVKNGNVKLHFNAEGMVKTVEKLECFHL